jgi:hypothetical protein
METSRKFEATFSLTYGERLRAGWALTLKSPASLAWLSVFPLFGIILLVLMLLPRSQNSAMDFVVLVGCFGFVPFMFLFNTYNAHRTERSKGPYTYRFDETGLQVTSVTSELKQSWAAIPRVRESAGILLLYFNKRCAHCVPLRALGGSGVAGAVMELASAAGVPRVGT